jgi:GT2 family glycosyltransferase
MKSYKVSVNILSFNRKEDLRFTLKKILEQDYKNIEIIVVDNSSTDGTREMVKTEFPNVKLIELKKNIGIAGWNKGFEAAKGEYVLVLDDDSYPDNGTISSGINLMLKDEKIAVVGFAIYNYQFNKIENDEYYQKQSREVEEVSAFIGCGAMIRRKYFLDLGGFDPVIFLYFNELDFSIRAKNAGYKILFEPNHRVNHTYSMLQRKEKVDANVFIGRRRFEHTFRSYFIFLHKNFSFIYFLKYSVKLILSIFYIAIRLGFLSTFFKIFLENISLIFKAELKRNPVAIDMQREYNFGNFKFNDIYVYRIK